MAKHFISALGTACYNKCDYELNGKSFQTCFAQEALLKIQDFSDSDRITILLTDAARKTNWANEVYKKEHVENLKRFAAEGEVLPKPGSTKEGLGSVLKKAYGEAALNPVTIPTGRTEHEIWSIFQIIYEQLKEEEEVYFDITNSLRSIPMLALTVLNYGKVLKNIKVKGIFYGALECKNKETGKVPIFDLTACNDILNWTVAADNFIRFGHSGLIGTLCKESTDSAFYKSWKTKLSQLVNLTNCIETSRGMEKNSVTDKETSTKMAFQEFKQADLQIQDAETVEKLVIPLFEKVEKEASIFQRNSNFEIGMATVKWSNDNNMIQQGFTSLQETIKTFLCNQYGLDEHDYVTRDAVVGNTIQAVKNCRTAITKEVDTKERRQGILLEDSAFQEWFHKLVSEDNIKKYNIGKYKDTIFWLASEIPAKLVTMYGSITDDRNDLNHFGYKKKPCSYKTLKNHLDKYFHAFRGIAEHYEERKLK